MPFPLSSGSYILSIPSSAMFPESSFEEMSSHLSLILRIWGSYEPLHSLHIEASLIGFENSLCLKV